MILLSFPLAILIATLAYGAYILFKWGILSFIQGEEEQVKVAEEAEILKKEIEQDFFNKLVKINFKYIDQYYMQTQSQAKKSFYSSLVAAFIGFAIIAAGIAQMYYGKMEPAYITTAAGTITSFVSGVFFYLYTKTVIHMSDYHRKLVLTQNLSLALKISEELPETERVKAQLSLIDKLSDKVNEYLATAVQNAPKQKDQKRSLT
jgi:hypothetical protein